MLPIPGIKEDEWIPYIISKFASRQLRHRSPQSEPLYVWQGAIPRIPCFFAQKYIILFRNGQLCLNQEYIDLGYNRALLALAPVFDGMIEDANNQPHAVKF